MHICFETAPEYRGRGIAKALLRRVCKDAEA
ncbi:MULTISPECIES: GNAT family N-acetyltransferase [Eisenbergiella]